MTTTVSSPTAPSADSSMESARKKGIGSSTQNSNGQRRLRELWDSYPQCNALKVDASHGSEDAFRRLNVLSVDIRNRLYKIDF
ncbi:hypothetical protein UY3_09255 [Chelonia mydas]|uniref:Uncharacterized protein n=1 Tax=Chelonia mydas TaxID=8469 RepID=M7B8S0_CHEMY|nr:hypothetical protein UY3_09255 [Chelonia mydas]